jgi:Spy/CpxP family protein refolding chaperone
MAKVKRSNKTLILSALLAGLLSGMPIVNAHGDEHRSERMTHHQRHMQDMRHMGFERAFAKLDLSEAQQSAIDSLKQENRTASAGVHEQLKSLHEQLKQAMRADDVNESEVRGLTSQIADLRSTMMIQHAKVRKQALAILNDEQRAKFEEMKARREAKISALEELDD